MTRLFDALARKIARQHARDKSRPRTTTTCPGGHRKSAFFNVAWVYCEIVYEPEFGVRPGAENSVLSRLGVARNSLATPWAFASISHKSAP